MKCKNHAFSELKIYSKYLILTKMCNLEIPGLGAHDDPRNSRSTNSGSWDCSHYIVVMLRLYCKCLTFYES